MTVLSNAHKPTQENEGTTEYNSNKQKQDKSLEADPNETEINNLLNKELKTMVIKMLTKVRGAKHGQSENFNKEKI